MGLKINWKKMLVISESITIILMAIVITVVVGYRNGFPLNSAIAYIFIFSLFAMPIAGIANFSISIKAGMKNSVITLCFFEALWTVVLIALVFYALIL